MQTYPYLNIRIWGEAKGPALNTTSLTTRTSLVDRPLERYTPCTFRCALISNFSTMVPVQMCKLLFLLMASCFGRNAW